MVPKQHEMLDQLPRMIRTNLWVNMCYRSALLVMVLLKGGPAGLSGVDRFKWYLLGLVQEYKIMNGRSVGWSVSSITQKLLNLSQERNPVTFPGSR